MADDIATNLIVSGGASFIKTLSDAAVAQDNLVNTIRRAAATPPVEIGKAIGEAALQFQLASNSAKTFNSILEQQGVAADIASKLTKEIERQNKALLDNAQAAEKAEQARRQRVVTEEARIAEQNRNNLFLRTAPTEITQGPLNVNESVTATKKLADAQEGATKTGVTYLSSLSAIHSASFLLFGTTFSLFQSLTTLGLAFSKVGVPAGEFNAKMAAFGTGLGIAAAGIHTIISTTSQIVTLFEQGAEAAVRLGVAGIAAFTGIAVASTKLASGAEDVFAEIAAFGEPTKANFAALETQISGLARVFGQSAKSIGEGASVFIRAGGDIETALAGGTKAVTLLQIAAHGELIPTQAARGIVTITNSFRDFNITAEQAVDIFVGTAQKSALSFQEVLQAFQQAAPTAALLKIPLIDLATTIGVLSNEGLRGQVAGTGFKQFLLDLLNPSKEARAQLEALGVSIQDQDHKIRPLRDIFIDLKKALGDQAKAADEAGDASRAQALASIFGSRANLAAAIIARTGAEAFDKLKESIAGVSAERVVEVLLSTTSAQLGIARTNVEELARAFGGPLNVAFGTALKGANAFLQSIDRSKFEAAGTAIAAIFSGGGFGTAIQAINSIDLNESPIKQFFFGVLNTLLNTRNQIISVFIPAVLQAGDTLNNAFGATNIASTFDSISLALAKVVAVGATVLTFAANLASDFITGNSRGQELRSTLTGIATAVGTSLVGALVAAAIPLGITIFLLSKVGEAFITLLSTQNRFNNIWEQGWQLAKDSVNNFLKDTAPRLQAFGDVIVGIANRDIVQIDRGLNNIKADQFTSTANTVIRQTGSIDKALQVTSETLQSLSEQISDLRTKQPPTTAIDKALGLDAAQSGGVISKRISDLEKEREDTLGVFNALQKINQAGPSAATSVLGTAAELADQIKQLQSNNVSLDSIFNLDSTDLPTFLTNLSAQLTDIENTFNKKPDQEPGTTGANFPNPKTVKKVTDQINDIIRRADQERGDIQADFDTKEIDLERGTLDRLLDLNTAFNRNIRKIDEERDKRIKESNETFNQQRENRNAATFFQQQLENEAFFRDQRNAVRDLGIRQLDAAEDRHNQRLVQDQDKVLSNLENREQRSEDIKQQIRDRAFQRQQQDAETLFSRQQSKEQTDFDRRLQDAATARQNAIRLAQAATPQQRADINKEIDQQRLDTAFTRQQEEQRRQFGETQDKARTEFSRRQEDSAFQNSVNNEQKAFDFRVALELRFLAIRRELEDKETIRQNGVEAARQQRQFGFALEDFGFRREQQSRLQIFQDDQADAEHERTTQRTRDEAAQRKQELGQKFVEDVFGIFDDADRRRIQNTEQSNKQLRNLTEREVRNLQQLSEREPTGATAAQAAIAQLNLELITTVLLFQKSASDAQQFFTILRDATIRGQGFEPEAPARTLQIQVPDFSPQLNQQIQQAQRIDFTPLLGLIPQAVTQTIQQLATAGIGQKSVSINTANINGVDDPVRLLQQLFNLAR